MKIDDRSDILESVESLLNNADDYFNSSKDWRHSCVVGKIDWLITTLKGSREELSLVWDMLERANNKQG